MRQQGTARPAARYLGIGAVLVAGTLLAGCGSSSGGGTTSAATGKAKATAAATGGVRLASTDAGMVLVDPRGRTLYAFAADTKGHSACTGSCLSYWPPEPGDAMPQSAPDGVTATFGEITRDDGSSQLTVDGFPVYTYSGDSGPGEASGQGLNLSGGLWWVLSASGSSVKDSPSSTGTADDSGGKYGY
jgi:predicted lipoprotein with Yx(FWY)xxD motif